MATPEPRLGDVNDQDGVLYEHGAAKVLRG